MLQQGRVAHGSGSVLSQFLGALLHRLRGRFETLGLLLLLRFGGRGLVSKHTFPVFILQEWNEAVGCRQDNSNVRGGGRRSGGMEEKGIERRGETTGRRGERKEREEQRKRERRGADQGKERSK